MPGGIGLSFHVKGLLVTGETYGVKELLKLQGGRWDAELRGWVFPFDEKQELLRALTMWLEGRELAVRDGAKVKLSLASDDGGRELVVAGETFPVKALLKSEGGTWTPAIKAWTFRNCTRTELVKVLRGSPDVACVEEDPGPATPPRPPARHESASDEGASASKATCRGRLRGKQAPAAKQRDAPPQPHQQERRQRQQQQQEQPLLLRPTVLPQQPLQLLKRPRPQPRQQEQPQQPRQQQPPRSGQVQQHNPGGLKVVESGKRSSKAERRADGTEARTEEERKERKISCAKTGAHMHTESVTRKRKVVETGDKVVETKTIVVRRVRSKK